MARTAGLYGKTDDPRILSYLLMRRLSGHRNAFSALTNSTLHIDAEIILRAAIETTICLRNLNVRGVAFYDDLKSDAARTVKGQIPIWFESDTSLGEHAKANMGTLFGAKRADGRTHTAFDWSSLAADGGIPDLYRWYKHLSGTAAHVTGLSIYDDDAMGEASIKLRKMRQDQSLRMMCGVAIIGSRAHMNTLEFVELDVEAASIMNRMAMLR